MSYCFKVSHWSAIKTTARANCRTASAGDRINGTQRWDRNRERGPIEWISSGCNDWRSVPVTGYIWLVLKPDLTGQQHTALTLSVLYAIIHLKQGHHLLRGEYEISLKKNTRESFRRQTKVQTVCHHIVTQCTNHHGQMCLFFQSVWYSNSLLLRRTDLHTWWLWDLYYP